MSKSPWLADAAKGATGKTFELRTVSDFLSVPEDRRRICLREFDAWLAMQEGVIRLLCAAGEHAIKPEQIHLKDADCFRWIDDGKATFTVRIETKGASHGA